MLMCADCLLLLLYATSSLSLKQPPLQPLPNPICLPFFLSSFTIHMLLLVRRAGTLLKCTKNSIFSLSIVVLVFIYLRHTIICLLGLSYSLATPNDPYLVLLVIIILLPLVYLSDDFSLCHVTCKGQSELR